MRKKKHPSISKKKNLRNPSKIHIKPTCMPTTHLPHFVLSTPAYDISLEYYVDTHLVAQNTSTLHSIKSNDHKLLHCGAKLIPLSNSPESPLIRYYDQPPHYLYTDRSTRETELHRQHYLACVALSFQIIQCLLLWPRRAQNPFMNTGLALYMTTNARVPSKHSRRWERTTGSCH